MYRRRFLKTGMALAAGSLGGILDDTAEASERRRATAAAAAPGLKRRGPARPFDYAALKGMARALSAAAYEPPTSQLPASLAKLSWDRWQAIQFRPERSLWGGTGLRFEARFFHLGFTMRKPVRLYTVDDGQAQEIAYDPAMFDYSRSGISGTQLPSNLGFAGFRLYFHTDWVRDVAAFQGASYFRAVDGDKQYGMSQRGLAIDTGMSTPEEFPDFIAYYLERPQKDSSLLTVYGLLDSPSVAGAYRFVIDVDDTIAMDIDAALYPRRQIEQLGIAPGTSMYFYGQNDRRLAVDVRPQIHDSDGLRMRTGAGEWLWRPLVNPEVVRVNSYFDENPRGFGLMQRDRNFDHYQDDGVFYDKRPSAWVEPRGDWGKGAVMLVEIPAVDETADNIVAFWTPADKPQRGQELLYGYRLFWCRESPAVTRLGTVHATRTGIGGVVGQKREYFSRRFEVDFAGGDLGLLDEGAQLVPMISATRGQIQIPSVRPLQAIQGWRALFDLRLTDESTEPINLRLVLMFDGQPLTETWLYQYTPPPANQRII